jgi:hypothetical protein
MTRRNTGFLLGGLVVALLLAAVVSSFASAAPDGLERVATDQGFIDEGRDSAVADSPFSDYGTTGVENDLLSGAVAGGLGVLLTFALGLGLFWLVRGRGDDASRRHGPHDGAHTADGHDRATHGSRSADG